MFSSLYGYDMVSASEISKARDMHRVKFIGRDKNGALAGAFGRQCPGFQKGTLTSAWENCVFLYDPKERNYDWLVVSDDLPRVKKSSLFRPKDLWDVSCPQVNTILVTSEPSSVSRYGHAFSRQFAHVLTSQEPFALPHPNRIYAATCNAWFDSRSYEEHQQLHPPTKTELISAVCSTKQQGHTVHAKRYAFIQRLRADLPSLALFGRGVNPIDRKEEAVVPFAFHIAIENHKSLHHWTEKIADAFLGYSVPIYYGAPNITDYFPAESVIQIDIEKYDEALAIIRREATFEAYQRRLPAVIEARRRILDVYNLPSLLCRVINERQSLKVQSQERVSKFSNRFVMRSRHPAELFCFAAWKFRSWLKGILVNGGKKET